jgi:hypothetical protein
MAPVKPLPSTAALNALRGLVFTTTCSVVLLAEERRRRLDIARAAVENARKLRDVKTKLRQSELTPGRIKSAAHSQSTLPRRRRRPRNSTPPLSAEAISPEPRPGVSNVSVNRSNPKTSPRSHGSLTSASTWTFNGQSALRYEALTPRGARIISNSLGTSQIRHFGTTTTRCQAPEPAYTPHSPAEPEIHPGHTSHGTEEPEANRAEEPETERAAEPEAGRAEEPKAERSGARFDLPSELFHPTDQVPLQSFDYEAYLRRSDLWDLIQIEKQQIKESSQEAVTLEETVRARRLAFGRFVEMVMQTHDPVALDATIRYLAYTESIKINGAWFHAVFDFYMRCPDPRPMLAWIPFCLQNDFLLRSPEASRLYNRCRRHWGFSTDDVWELHTQLSRFGGSVPPPSRSFVSIKPQETWRDIYFRQCGKLISFKDWARSPHAGVFFVMQKAAEDGYWDIVWRTFQESESKTFLPCFSLAVFARVELDKGRPLAARNLVWSYAESMDISHALTPVLIAQLRSEYSPREVITEALELRVHISDTVYQMAAGYAVSRPGFEQDAIDICYEAVRNNGQGDVLYNISIFSYLSWALARMRNYPALHRLTEEFLSRPKPPPSAPVRRCRTQMKKLRNMLARRSVKSQSTMLAAHNLKILRSIDKVVIHLGALGLDEEDPETQSPEIRRTLAFEERLKSGIVEPEDHRSQGTVAVDANEVDSTPGSSATDTDTNDAVWEKQALDGIVDNITSHYEQIGDLLKKLSGHSLGSGVHETPSPLKSRTWCKPIYNEQRPHTLRPQVGAKSSVKNVTASPSTEDRGSGDDSWGSGGSRSSTSG